MYAYTYMTTQKSPPLSRLKAIGTWIRKILIEPEVKLNFLFQFHPLICQEDYLDKDQKLYISQSINSPLYQK